MLPPFLTCPYCSAPLEPVGATMTCARRHTFDRARQGYFNLLPVGDKKSREPGDTAAAIAARASFLDGGHYEQLAARLAELIGAEARVLDVGCGDGYWLTYLKARHPAMCGVGIDISKAAIRHAARRSSALTWLVGSARALPVADASLDVVLNLFSPQLGDGWRVLRPGGLAVVVNGGARHLQELHAALLPGTPQRAFTPRTPAVATARLPDLALSFPFEVADRDTLAALVDMTPYRYRTRAELREAFVATAPRQLTADFVIHRWQTETVDGKPAATS